MTFLIRQVYLACNQPDESAHLEQEDHEEPSGEKATADDVSDPSFHLRRTAELQRNAHLT